MSANSVGSLAALWRYPVKSMQGEALDTAAIGARGLSGDRTYAVRELATGHIASAKHPRKWATLLACRARYLEPPLPGAPLPPVLILAPDGTTLRSDQPDADALLSRLVGREVTLTAEAPVQPTREADRSPLDGPADVPTIRQEPLAPAAPAGTFFDYAPVHLLTTTLAALGRHYPAGQFDLRRFRPNIVIVPADAATDFVEQSWLGQTLSVGAASQLALIDPCPRCVVTTLAQGDLPRDPQILRTVGAHTSGISVTLAPGFVFQAVVGIYGRAIRGGTVRVGDCVALTPGDRL